MSKLRKKFIGALTVLFCALLLLSTALIIPKNKTAEANSISNVLDLGDDGNFSARALRTLYGNIYSGAITYDMLSSKLGNDTGKVSRTYSQMSTKTTVRLGSRSDGSGLEWNVVAASKNQAGEVIVTLWLSESEYISAFSDTSFISNSSYPSSSQYFSAEYGVSLMRSTLVGDIYATSAGATQTGAQKQVWADFTAKYGDFMDSPYEVCGSNGYQATQKAPNSSINRSYLLPNEAYGNVGTSTGNGNWYNTNTANLTNCPEYSRWKGDKLWLPSLSETGSNTPYNGLWGIDNDELRANNGSRDNSGRCWLRSAYDGSDYSGAYILFDHFASGLGAGYANSNIGSTSGGSGYGVKPAFHLNLAKAANNAKGVAYDAIDVTTNVDAGSKNVTNTEKAHTFTHTYDGDDVEVEFLERAKFQPISSTDYTSGASYNATSGKFIAKYPEQKPDASGEGDKTYEISVQPKAGYVWDDSETSEARKYEIKISLASMTVGWQGFSAQLGDNLLRPDSEITVIGNSADSPLKVRYYIIEPNSTDTPPANTADWTERGTVSDPTVSVAGTYQVHYEITANYHKTEKSVYSVSVGVENVVITATDSIGSAIYSEGDTVNLTDQTWLISKIKNAISVTKGGQPYDSVDTLLGNLEVVVSNKSGNSYVKADTNIYERYNAGTYYLDLKFKVNANQSVQFTWANSDRPTFVVEKLPITVEVIPATDGGTLTHVYGDSTFAAMKYRLVDDPADGEDVDDVITGAFIRKDNNTALSSTTPVGKYEMIGVVDENGNYDITFKKSVYEVTKKPVTIKIVDEEVEYGTDLSDHEFEFTTDDALARGETLENVISSENVNYTVYMNGNEVSLHNTLYIGEYEVRATVTADNYIFTVEGGKLTVTQASFDLSGVKLNNAGYIYDGEPHPAQLSGDALPEEVSCTFRYVNYETGEELDGVPTEVGQYLVYASFSHNSTNHKPITDVKAAYIRIAYTQEELNQPYPPLPSDEDLAAAADLAKKKTEAKKKLDEEAQAKKDAIDSNKDMTAEDKKAAKEEIEKELAEGNAAIDGAKNASDVNKAYDNGKKEMEDTVELAETKTDAKKDLDNTAKEKKDAIDSDVNLSAEEKKAAKDEIDKELKEGNAAIDKAKDADGVNKAYDDGKKEMEDTTELAQKKGAAKSELDKAAQAKKDAIDNDPNLTDEEKAAAKAEVDKELEEGKKAIDGANSIDGVSSAESSTKTNIENIKAEHKGSFPWWILAIIAGAILLVTVLIIVIVKRRNSDDDDGGYDDFYDDEYDYDEEEIEDDGDEAYGF